ncbi:MAG: hypothetical protein ACIARR_06505 [Phycisphaerales bacterium JB059]
MTPLDLVLLALALYLALGALFALYFAIAGAARIDPSARSGSIPFRLLILPASAMLWPALAIMCLRAAPRPHA